MSATFSYEDWCQCQHHQQTVDRRRPASAQSQLHPDVPHPVRPRSRRGGGRRVRSVRKGCPQAPAECTTGAVTYWRASRSTPSITSLSGDWPGQCSRSSRRVLGGWRHIAPSRSRSWPAHRSQTPSIGKPPSEVSGADLSGIAGRCHAWTRRKPHGKRRRTLSGGKSPARIPAHRSSSGIAGHALTTRVSRRAVVRLTGRPASAPETVPRVRLARRATSVSVSPRTRIAWANSASKERRLIM